MEELYKFVFSPTGTSRKIADVVFDELNFVQDISFDVTDKNPSEVSCSIHSLAIISVPVYGGKVAPLALERLENIKGQNTPVVLIVLYGNRAYEEALKKLSGFVSNRGFIPIAAAAFIGEHSYSTRENPIALGRPDEKDLLIARNFGRNIGEKLQNQNGVSPVNVSLKPPHDSFFVKLRFIRFVLNYCREQKNNPELFFR